MEAEGPAGGARAGRKNGGGSAMGQQGLRPNGNCGGLFLCCGRCGARRSKGAGLARAGPAGGDGGRTGGPGPAGASSPATDRAAVSGTPWRPVPAYDLRPRYQDRPRGRCCLSRGAVFARRGRSEKKKLGRGPGRTVVPGQPDPVPGRRCACTALAGGGGRELIIGRRGGEHRTRRSTAFRWCRTRSSADSLRFPDRFSSRDEPGPGPPDRGHGAPAGRRRGGPPFLARRHYRAPGFAARLHRAPGTRQVVSVWCLCQPGLL